MNTRHILFGLLIGWSLQGCATQTQQYGFSYNALVFLQRLYGDDILGADGFLRADRKPFLIMYTNPAQTDAVERIVLCAWYSEYEWRMRGSANKWNELLRGISFLASCGVTVLGGLELGRQRDYDVVTCLKSLSIGIITGLTLMKLLEYTQNELRLSRLRVQVAEAVCTACGIPVPPHMVPVMLLATPYTIYDAAKETGTTKSHIIALSQTEAANESIDRVKMYSCSVADIPAEELFYTYIQEHMTCTSCCS